MNTLFEYYIETDNLHIKYAKGEPAVKEQEFHNYNEFVLFMKGNTTFISKNIQYELTPGSIIIIPKEHFHQFCVKQPESYVRCILAFRETPEIEGLANEVMDTVKVITAPDIRITSIFEQLIEVVQSELSNDEKTMFIYSSLVQLLIHLKRKVPKTINEILKLSPVVRKTLDIIDENFAENLSVAEIAKKLNVSSSTLAHKFRKELNISVYRYVIKRRISAARELIEQGETLTSAALNSGFSDYSCFYRLYKKYYKK